MIKEVPNYVVKIQKERFIPITTAARKLRKLLEEIKQDGPRVLTVRNKNRGVLVSPEQYQNLIADAERGLAWENKRKRDKKA